MKGNLAVGIDRRVDLAWLEATAGQVARGASDAEVREYLMRLLDGAVAGEAPRGGRAKTVTVLSHVWSRVPAEAQGLRARAVRTLVATEPAERVAIHWAMVMGTYPFAADVSAALGRVLALHETAGLAQIVRKVTSTWGERSTVVRATQRLVRSMVEWGALRDGGVRGTFLGPAVRQKLSSDVSLLLLESVLLGTRVERMRLGRILSHPSLFPFVTAAGVSELRSAAHFGLTQTVSGEEEVGVSREQASRPGRTEHAEQA